MRSKRLSKSLKVAANWAPGPRTRAWEELWRRILQEVLRPAPRNSDVEGRDGFK